MTEAHGSGHCPNVMPTHRILLLSAATLTACTLGPSPLGELPDEDSAGQTATTSTSADTNPEPSSGGSESSGSSGGSSGGGSSSGGEGPPGSAWEQYCDYVNAHGGECDPMVDMFADLRYPGGGFIVHEWGTDTIVVGSGGAPQRGLHHEEEDLPGFVYDRLSAGALEGSMSVHVKMETPVTYFYSDVPRSAHVAVGFPDGVFTQWYPAVARFEPWIAAPTAIPKLLVHDDPVLNPHFPFIGDACRSKYSAITAGLLDWGTVEVLARDAEAPLLEAPLADFTWSHARAVEANLVRIAGVPGAVTPQHERFLFYRGLGNFPLPLTITASEGPALELSNTSDGAVGRVFVIRVEGDRGAFSERGEGVAPAKGLSTAAPELASAPPLDLFAEALAERVTEALDATGLYHDEAVAMVETWKRQWFRTPGLRVLYLVPQAWTDASIPLTIDPAPDEATRVMMIRAEVITVEQELADVAAAGLLADPDTAPAGRDHFIALGRFAEPRLRRAAELLGEPAYLDPLLDEVLHADTRVAAGE